MNKFEIEDALTFVRLPKFALFQNLEIKKTGPDPEPSDPFESCDWFKLSDEYSGIEVPSPLLTKPEMFVEIINKYGTGVPKTLASKAFQDLTDLEIESLRERAREHADFDTTIMEFCEWKRFAPMDKDLYGVRYTLFYLCPRDPAMTIADLKKRTQKMLTDMPRTDTRWMVILGTTWETCMGRRWIYPADDEAYSMLEAVNDGYEQWLNALPDPPTRADWDDLNESLMK